MLLALRMALALLALRVALSAVALGMQTGRQAAVSRPVTARVCSHCAAVLPAPAHPSRTTCSRTCKEALYRQRRRERRREEARERPAKRVPRDAPKINTDTIAASLAARERAIITTWRAGR